MAVTSIARLVRRMNNQGYPAVFHTHPWEVDPWRPPIRQPLLTKLVLTVKFSDLRKRLDRILGEFPFGLLTEVAGEGLPVYTPEELP